MQTIDLPTSHVSRLNVASARIQRVKLLLKRRWWVLALTASIGIFYQAVQTFTAPKVFESVGRLAVGGKVVMQGGLRYSEEANNFYKTQEEIIESPQVRERAETRVETLNPQLKHSSVKINVYRDSGSSIFNVVASGGEPEYTQALLDGVLNEYIKYRSELRSVTSDNTITAITGQIYRLEKQVEEAAADLTRFTESNNVIVLEQGGNSAAAYLASLNARLAQFETELDLLQRLDLDQNIDRHAAGADIDPAAAGLSPDDTLTFSLIGPEADYLRAKQNLELLKARKTAKAQVLQPAHPDMIDLDEQIKETESLVEIHRRQSIQKYKQREAAIELQIANLKDEITDWEARALETSTKLNQYAGIKAKLANAQALYNRLSGSLRELDINKNLEQENVYIMQHASAAFARAPESVQKIAMGAILGLFAGAALLFLIDRLDDRINGYAEFQANFSEDVLGQIPQQQEEGKLSLIRVNDDRHLYAEAFRNLRSSILFKQWHPSTPKTILITSAVPAEGKTTIAGNLAVTMALSGARVLLVDGDVRRGSLHEHLGRSNERGVSEILTKSVSWREAVQRTDHENLFFIARGSATDHTSERFLSGVAPSFLSDAGKNFDYVIIDSAPVLVADDTTTIAPMVDTVLFVIRMSNTLARLSAKALDLLYDRQVRIGGVILNRASTNLKEYTYYGYANYYTNRAREEDDGDDEGPKALTA